MDTKRILGLGRDHHDDVRKMTPEKTNRRIDETTAKNLERVSGKGSDAIRQRLAELDREWDIDRVLMANFALLVYPQLVLAMRHSRRWLWGPLLQTPFLFMHAALGWCPPSLWFRPLGFRTRKEIEAERAILERELSA